MTLVTGDIGRSTQLRMIAIEHMRICSRINQQNTYYRHINSFIDLNGDGVDLIKQNNIVKQCAALGITTNHSM